MDTHTTTKSWFSTLAFKLGVPFLLFVIVLVSVISSLIYFSYTSDQRKIQTVPQNIARSSRDAVSGYFEEIFSLLTVSGLSFNTESVPDYTFINKVVSSNDAIMALSVLTPTGDVLYQVSDPTVSFGDVAFRDVPTPYIEKAFSSEDPIVSHTFTTAYHTPAVAVFVPIYDKHDQHFRVLEAIIDVTTLWDELSAIARETNATIFVTDEKGTIILSNIATKLVSNDEFRSIWNRLLISQHLATPYTNVFGVKVVGSTTEVPEIGWFTVSEVELVTLNADTRQNLLVLAVLSLAFFVLLIISINTFRSELLVPLNLFRKHSERLTRGEYGSRITLTVRNELRDLAEVMNTMSASIENQTSQIVEKLKATIDSLDKNSKILVRRDIELSTANEKLRSLDRAKSEFVSIAAHQLRTPLSAIKWAQQMLMDGELGPLTSEQATVVHQSQESVTRMANLVNDLLSADHLEFDRVQYAFAEIDLNDVLQHLTDELSATAKERSMNFTFTKAPQGARIVGDTARLSEAFLNILNNALKYTPMRGTVTVSITTTPETATVSIKDSGIGIPKADRNRLFEKFVRMDNAKKVDANGSGLGLFIVKKIIEGHHGKIWFTSDEGSGTEFFMEFPLAGIKNTY